MNAEKDMGQATLVVKGIVGSASPMFAIAISMQSTIMALQIVSLTVGIAVGIATFISIIRGKK